LNIYVLSSHLNAINIINLIKEKIKIKGIIGLSSREISNKISDYYFFEDYCKKNNLDFIQIESYNLINTFDKEKLDSLTIDVLLVLSWQRLIPNWLIKSCNVCAIGVHGSSNRISGGRGRSPLNWALILGKKKFYISIFTLDEGIDSGLILNTKTFSITNLDNIKTVYKKPATLIAQMLLENFQNKEFKISGKIQSGPFFYLPQRIPEDGILDWNQNSKRIYDSIRALTKPYPGAFSIFESTKITIWDSQPFELEKNPETLSPGEIIQILDDGKFLIRTMDGLLLITNYSIDSSNPNILRKGLILPSVDFKITLSKIIERHYKKYPDLRISPDIEDLIK